MQRTILCLKAQRMGERPVQPLIRFLRNISPAAPDDAPDGQLLVRFLRQRDEGAFTALFRRHGPMVWGVCWRVLRDSQAAEDAFQATFLVFVRKAGSIGRPELLANWLYGVAYRTASRAKSLLDRRRVREQQGNVETALAEESDAALWRDLRPVLDEELQSLPEKYRIPLVLCYLEGKTYTEAAQALGWAEGTVSGRLARARDLLRSRLLRRGLGLSAGALAGLQTPQLLQAAMPTTIAKATIQAALVVAANKTAVAGVVSAQAAALSEGVMQAMFLSKLKIAGAVLLAVTLTGAGTGTVAHCLVAADDPIPSRKAAGPTISPATQLAVAQTPAAQPERAEPQEPNPPSAVSPDGRVKAVGIDKAISLFDVGTGKELARLQSHKGKVTGLAFSPDGKSLASVGEDKVVMVWDRATGKLLWKSLCQTPITSLTFSADGRTLIVKQGNTKQTFEAATGKEVQSGNR